MNKPLDASSAREKWFFEIPPEPIKEELIEETIVDDLIVVGSGMSGLVTAYSAIQNGLSVTLFSASSRPVSRGGSNFAKNSRVMEQMGIKPFDPGVFFYNEERAASFSVDQKKWMRGYNNSEEAMNWLIDIVEEDGLGVVLERDNDFDKGPYYAHAFNTHGDDAMVSKGQQGAVESLALHIQKAGGNIIYKVTAVQLEREDNNTGRVTAVIGRKKETGTYVRFEGTKGIVLATGDFSADKQMLAKYCPNVLAITGMKEEPVDYDAGFRFSGLYRGEGQKMGLWIGAAWQRNFPNAPMIQGEWGGAHEPMTFHWGLNIDYKGQRYHREDVSAPYASNHLIYTPGRIAYAIWTANYAQAIIDAGHEWFTFGSDFVKPAKTAAEMIEIWENGGTQDGHTFKADTLEAYAEEVGVDVAVLRKTIERYNELCAKGVDEDFCKNAEFMIPIDMNGPFYGAKNRPIFMTVMGGLRTNELMQVCDEDDEPIEGLFNVGSMVGDMYSNIYNFAIPGVCYGINCLTFGYLLGRDIAQGKFDK